MAQRAPMAGAPPSTDNRPGDVLALLTALPSPVGGLNVSAYDEVELRTLLAAVRHVQRSLDGLVLRIGGRANALAATGASAPAEETARGGGTVSARQARREAARADVAMAMPQVGKAAAAGKVSGEHIDAIARQAGNLSEEQRQQLDQAALVAKASALPLETFERFLRREINRTTEHAALEETTAKQAASELRHWFDRDTGMGKLYASLDPELYERVAGAIDRHASSMANNAGQSKNANLSARALGELVSNRTGTGATVPAVTVVVDHATMVGREREASICQTESGHDLAAESVARLCCDAVLRRVVLDRNHVPIEVGRARRTASESQWAAIKAVHTSCAWAGCQAPIGWCQAHHIHEWERGGPTDLCNLVPLCSRHHHRVHEGRWTITMASDRSLRLHRPDGQLHATVPTPMRC